MNATHPSAASGLADRMALALEELLVATSPDGILGRLCTPLFWVLGKLMQRRMRREIEKLVEMLRQIAKDGLPAPVQAPIEPAASRVRADGEGDFARPGIAQGGFVPADGGPSGAGGAWDGAGAYEWQDRAEDAEATRQGSDSGRVGGPMAPTPRDEPAGARERHAMRDERRPASGTFGRPFRMIPTAGRASAFGRKIADADGGRARSRIARFSS